MVGLARNQKPGYLVALAKSLDVSYGEIVERLEDWECADCSCIYLDPCLSYAALGRLYQEAAPIHNAGWSVFSQKLLGVPIKQNSLEALKNYLNGQGIGYHKYLEVGCPFTGLSLTLVDRTRVRQGFLNAIRGGNRYSSAGKPRILRHSDRLQQLWQGLLAIFFRTWLSARDLIRSDHNGDQVEAVASHELYFLGEYSGHRWSIGCHSFGSSCYSMSSSALSATTLSVGQLRDLPDKHFKLAGIFNTLDHSDSPLDLLQLVARKSNFVLVTSHALADAHLQHSFAFSSDTVPWICMRLGLECQDISEQVGNDARMNTYLIRSASNT